MLQVKRICTKKGWFIEVLKSVVNGIQQKAYCKVAAFLICSILQE
jgi:hypothetical protein